MWRPQRATVLGTDGRGRLDVSQVRPSLRWLTVKATLTGWVDTCSSEVDCKVTDAGVDSRVDGNEDDVPDGSSSEAAHVDESSVVTVLVGKESNNDGDTGSYDVDGYTEQVGFNGSPSSKGSNNGRSKDGEGVEGTQATSVDSHSEPSLGVESSLPDVSPREALTCGRVSLTCGKSVDDEGSFLFREPLCLVWEVGDTLDGQETRDDGDDTDDNEDPSPSVGSARESTSTDLGQTGRKESTERSRGGGRGEEDGRSKTELFLGVPTRHEVLASGEEGSFKDTEEESHGQETVVVVDETLSHHADTDECAGKAEPEGRAQPLE